MQFSNQQLDELTLRLADQIYISLDGEEVDSMLVSKLLICMLEHLSGLIDQWISYIIVLVLNKHEVCKSTAFKT